MLSLIGSIADDTDWMNRKITWITPTVQEEIIQLMANNVQWNVTQEVKGNSFML